MKAKVISILLLFACHLYSTDSSTSEKTCLGSISGLSIRGDTLHHYKQLHTLFSNCTTVEGNLEINGLKNEELDFSFLENIEVVTGYVLIAFNSVRRISLSKLRVIHGRTLHEGKYALYVYHNIDKKTRSIHLSELVLDSLAEIVHGGVYFKNNKLCFIKTIQWNDILNSENAPKRLPQNQSSTCGECDKSCRNGSCWAEGPSMCQKFTKTVCHSACRGRRCRGPEPHDCCDRECAGGCTGSTDGDCKSCLNVNNSGVCESSCPPELILDRRTNQPVPNPNHRFRYLDQCLDECPENLLVEKNLCVKSCRKGFHDDGNGRCVACHGRICDKECYGVQHSVGPLADNETVDALNVHHFEGCSIIRGNLIFLTQAFTGDEAVGTPPMNSSALKVFKNLKKVTGYLKIVDWPKDLTNFSIFQNLEEVGGVDLFQDVAALAIYGVRGQSPLNQITSLGFRSLKAIHHGNVVIRLLRNLCYARLIDWQKLLGHIVKSDKYKFDNGTKIELNGDNCTSVRCHPYCNEDGCWGPGPSQCLKCNETKFTFKGTCYNECQADMGLYAIPGVQECQLCDPECKSCFGPGAGNCSSCKNFDDSGTCVSQCPLDKYEDISGKCLLCNETCIQMNETKTCTGSKSTTGTGGCEQCNYALATRALQVVKCLPLNATCPEAHFVFKKLASVNNTCIPCYDGCRECNGSKREDCFHDIPLSGRSLVLAISIPITVLIIFIVLVVPCCIHKRREKKRKQILTMKGLVINESPELNSDPTARLMEPMTPSGVAPNQAHLRIVKDDELKITKLLGSGAFGTVHKGFWTPDVSKEKVTVPVAIKVLRDDSSQVASNELLDEAFLMASCQHPYLVRLLGICLSQKIMLITQLMPLGNLLDFVRNNKDNIGSQYLLNWSLQIAKGMCYLSDEKHLVHRDLAARNVLVRSPHHVRITDFGLAKLLDVKEDVYRAEGGKMPIKWLALESIQHRIFTQKSDVWSFGVTMWELMTFGKRPYENVQAKDVLSLLERGERLSQPSICTIDIYMLLIKCWTVDAEARPTFRELAEELSRMARDPQRYIVIANEEFHTTLPSPSPSEILSDLKNEMHEVSGQCQIADADDYFLNSSKKNGMNGFSLQPVPTTVPWKRQQHQSLSSTSSQNFLLGRRGSEKNSFRMNRLGKAPTPDKRSDSVVTAMTQLSGVSISPQKSQYDSSSVFASPVCHENCDEILLGVGDARFFSRRRSSEDSPNTATFSDAFDVFGPPTPKRLEDVAEVDDCNGVDTQSHSVRAREDSTTLRYSAEPVALLRQETQPNGKFKTNRKLFQQDEGGYLTPFEAANRIPVYLDPSELPASLLTSNSQMDFSFLPASALSNPEYEAPCPEVFPISKDTEGYEVPIGFNKLEVDYENLPQSNVEIDEVLRHHSHVDKNLAFEQVDSDSGSPSDDEMEKRKTSSVENPNYHWFPDGDIHKSTQPDYQNIGLETDVAAMSYIEDEIFNSVIKAANGQCKQAKVNQRTYSEPDSGVGIEVGVDNILYHKIGPERNV